MKLQDKIETIVKTEEIQSVSIDLAESVIDLVIDDEVLKGFPIIGPIVGLTKGIFTIKDRLLTKKLIHLLTELKSIPLEQRNEQIDKINNSQKYESSIGEKLLFVIDKAEDSKTSSIIGKLLKLCLLEKISYNTFISCSQIINSTNVDLIKAKCINNLLGRVEKNKTSETNLPQYLFELSSLNAFQLLILKWAVIRESETHENLKFRTFYEFLMENSEIEQSEEVIMFKTNLFQLGFKNILDPNVGLNSIPDFPTKISTTEYTYQLFNVFELAEIVGVDIEIVDKLLRRK